jgi:pilus assembly protein CpaE
MAVQELHTSSLLLAYVCDKETEEIISTIPFQNYGLKYEGFVGGIKEAIKHLKSNRSPKILIIDISLSELPINDISSLSEVCEPSVEVIVIGTRNDVGIFRELIKLGIRDYLVKPLTPTHLIRSIENIISQNKGTNLSSFSRFGKIVSFIGTRGGIGVTTLAVNCAWILAEVHSRRIGMIDPNLQLGTVAQFLDLESSTNFQEILESPERVDESLIDRFMVKYSPHLMVMTGQSSLEEPLNIKPEAFDPILKSMVSNFHYTILDLPHHFSDGLNIHLIGYSNIIILVTELSIIGLKDSHRYFELFKRHRTTDQQILVVVNKHGQHHDGALEIEDFEKALNHKIDLIIPFDPQKPLQALTKGAPFVSDRGISSPLGKRLEELTDKIMGREAPTKAPIKNIFKLFSFKK